MSDSLATDPFIRRSAVTAGIIALAVVIVGAAAYLLTRSEPVPDFRVRIGLVSPTDDNRVDPSFAECPNTERAPSPLPGSDFETSRDDAERSAFGTGQLVAYNVRVIATEAAPDAARFILRFSDTFQPGVRCAFIVEDDPDTTDGDDGAPATLVWRDASGSGPAGQIELSGLAPGDQVVAQLWVVLAPDGASTPELGLDVTPGAGTDAEPVSRRERVNLGLPPTAVGDPTVEIDDGTTPAVIGEAFTTDYVVRNDTDSVLNQVVLTAQVDAGAAITGARIVDETGAPTSCRTPESRLRCDLGFLNVGETVTVRATLSIDEDAITFWGRDTGACENDDQQDLCQRAELQWAGPFSPDSVETSEVTNIDDISVFSVSAVPGLDVGYLLGSVPVIIDVTTDAGRATITEVATNGCPIATYLAGDTVRGEPLADPAFATDGDGYLDAGEIWQFTCAARQYDEGRITVVVAGEGDGLPGRTEVQLEIEVINPMVSITRTDGAEVTWTVTNEGDTPLESVAVAASGCQPRIALAGDFDAVLAEGEAWTFTCPAGADVGVGTVFALDPLGATVSAVDQTAPVP